MAITNTYKTALQLPNGTVLHPGVPTPVHDWETIRKNHVVAAWVKAKILVESEQRAPDDDESDRIAAEQAEAEASRIAAESAASGDKQAEPNKDDLIAQLKALGIKADKRMSLAKLQAMLVKA